MTNNIDESDIEGTLLTIGIPANLAGFAYITYAETLVLEQPDYLHSIVKCLYYDVAKHFNTTPSRVERCIRHAIQVAWLRGDYDFITYLFGNSVDPMKGTPTNSQFIARMYYYFLRNSTNRAA